MPIPYHILKEAPIDRAVYLLLFEAADAEASELIFEPNEKNAVVRMRRDGLLHDVFRHPTAAHESVLRRLKELARLRTYAPLSAQSAPLRRVVDAVSLEGQLMVVPLLDGEKGFLRLRPPRRALQDLGISDEVRQRLLRLLRRPAGLLLIAGPRRSGVTTTLHALLEACAVLRTRVALVEDRGEAEIIGVTQDEVDVVSERTSAALVRAALARGAEVIGIGALRDEATAAVVASAAEHRLVIAVLEAATASQAIGRLLDLRIDPRRASVLLNGVLTQRLVRRTCRQCLKREMVTLEHARAADWPRGFTRAFFGKETAREIARGGKCDRCRFTGHQGQIGVFELLDATGARGERTSLREDAVRTVRAGIVAPEEAIRL